MIKSIYIFYLFRLFIMIGTRRWYAINCRVLVNMYGKSHCIYCTAFCFEY